MEKIVFKKSWVNRIGKMHREQQERCIIALFDYLHNECSMTEPCLIEQDVREFMKSIDDEVSHDKIRQEKARKTREAKKERAAREAAEKENQMEQLPVEANHPESAQSVNDNQNVFKTIDYAAHPEMYIIEGFVRYTIATGDSQFTSILPRQMTLASFEKSLANCFATGQRYSNISRLTSTTLSKLRHAVREIV